MNSKLGLLLFALALLLVNPFGSIAARGVRRTTTNGTGTTGSGSAMVRLIRADEKSNGLGVSAAGATVSRGHETELVFRFMSTADVSTSGGAAITGGSAGTTASTSGIESDAGGTGTTGSSAPLNYTICVNSPYVIGQIPAAPTRVASIYGGGSFPGAGAGFTIPAGQCIAFKGGEEVPLQILAGSNGVITPGTLTVSVAEFHPADTTVTPNIPAFTNYWQTKYQVTKAVCPDASVDTRKAFGQPNLDGEMPGDPNAPPSALNFGNWVWKGGLFVGNMPWTTFDQSGLARIQLYPGQGTAHANPRLLSLSMYNMGSPPTITSTAAIGVFAPDPADPNLNTSESTVTWATRWTSIVPEAAPVGGRRDALDAAFADSDSTSNANDFLNWTLTTVTPQYASTDAMMLDKIGLCLVDETDLISGSSPITTWHYFASKEYQDATLAYPRNDCAPKLWIVDILAGSTVAWTVTQSTTTSTSGGGGGR